ncbi:NAD(P)H-hydrate dehydratase [Uliginosibacterium sp. sgz301328]|uniref:NAD(P)H-hydrate dehydratase n=1 Tax=Uliginosibacterium sp. sgz301328 TaxID=3243764 RepID=UPI00359DDBF9
MNAHTAQRILPVADIRRIEAAQGVNASPPLMERAGLAAARCALALFGEREGVVLVVAGPGNNGGDGYVVARLLREAGREVVVASMADPDRLPPDAAAAYGAWMAAGGSVVDDFVGGQWALVVDALLGIGVTRPVEGRLAEWIERINAFSCPVLSLDVPSGLDADTGVVYGVAVRATHTATFIAAKPGLLTLDGPDHCGTCSVHDLELDLDKAGGGRVIQPDSFAAWLKPRARNSHKGTHGEAGIVGGAAGMAGAALLAGRAALRLGAGRVYVGMLDAQVLSVDVLQPELMLRPAGDVPQLASALLVGCGLGQSEAALQIMRRALAFDGPLIIDADGLNLLGAQPALVTLLQARRRPTVLTPHPAEAGRLLRRDTHAVQASRIAAAVEIAQSLRAHVVLKGCGSIVATPQGGWSINTSGHAGLATAGTGDVLAGFIVALLAQGWPAEAALPAAVHLHGAAADLLLKEGVGPIGLTAGELADAGRRLLNAWIAARAV